MKTALQRTHSVTICVDKLKKATHVIKADFNSGTECRHCTVEFM